MLLLGRFNIGEQDGYKFGSLSGDGCWIFISSKMSQAPSVWNISGCFLYSAIDSLRILGGVHRKVYKNLHRALSKRFPFAIYYTVESSTAASAPARFCRLAFWAHTKIRRVLDFWLIYFSALLCGFVPACEISESCVIRVVIRCCRSPAF